jgi:phosphatidylglycerophosphate synthase
MTLFDEKKMLDPYVRTLINPSLNSAGKRLAQLGVTPNSLTLLGFGAGLFAMVAVAHQHYTLAAILIAINRLLDGLDGAVARHGFSSDFGGVLDISCDFIIYAGLVFAFGLNAPENLFYATFLIFSFIGPITTFLAYATIAAKRQMNTKRRGIKSFYHLGGICEGTETAFVLLLICLYPETFQWVCLIYGGLCWLTTVGRLYRAWADFGEQTLPVREPPVENRQ